MKLKFSILTSIILITSCVKNQPAIKEHIRTVPEEAKQCVITTHYTPILHEGKWICGEEYKEISVFNTIVSDTIYYDEFNNKLLWILKGGHVLNRYIYHSPEEGLLEKIYSLSEGMEKVDSAIYIRNAEGKLIELVVRDYIFQEGLRSRKYSYNSEGERNEIVEGNTRTIIERSPSKEGLIINSYKKLEKQTNSDDKTEELIEKGIEILNAEGQLLRTISEYYKYGKVKREEEFTLTYDEKGREIKQEMNGKSVNSFYAIPHDLKAEDKEEYIKENYYKNIEYNPIGHVVEWKYNNQGDLESYLVKSLNSSGLLKTNDYRSERYEYVYDSKGRWIERYSYRIYENNTSWSDRIAGVPDKIEKNYKPHLITIREIIDL